MNKWEKEVQQSLLKDEESVIRNLEKAYKSALDEINTKISDYTLRISKNADDTSAIYQKQYQEMLKSQVEASIQALHSTNYTEISKYLEDSYKNSYAGTFYNMQKQGVPLAIPMNQEDMVRAITLNSKISEGLYKRLGVDTQQMKKRITAEVTRGIASGSSWEQIAKQIGMKSGVTYSNAVRIARTEGHRIQQQSSLDAMNKAKSKGADIVKQWDATLDGKTRSTHRELDGQIVELNQKFKSSQGDVDAPGMFGIPSEDCNCRCMVLQRARWSLDGGFTKMDGFTDEIREFNDPKDYEQFKEWYWSEDNLNYMNYVSELETKYGTNDFTKILDKMSDREYKIFKELESKSPLIKENLRIKAVEEKQNPWNFSTIQNEHNIEFDIRNSNPNYSTGERLFTQNCGYCSATVEMRRRGFDVEANGLDGMYLDEWKDMFDGFQANRISAKRKSGAIKEITENCISYGDGARGGVFVVWDGRSWGHYFNFEVENGKVSFVDGQCGNIDVLEYFNQVKPSSIVYGRWDNLEPNFDAIQKACKNRGEK